MRTEYPVAGSRWTEAEKVYLREHYQRSPLADISLAIGRSIAAVIRKAKKLGLRRYRVGMTPEQQQVIRTYYQSHGGSWCAARIGMHAGSVWRWARRNGLRGPTRKARDLKTVHVVAGLLQRGGSNLSIGKRIAATRGTVAGIRRDIKAGKYEGLSL